MGILHGLWYGFGIHVLINTAPIYCNILMYPLNVITGVHCVNEAGHIIVKGRPEKPTTVFEQIVSGQGIWPWMLFGLIFPNPLTYYFNGYIICSTIFAYPAAICQLVSKGW